VLHFPEVEAVERPEVEVVAACVHHHLQHASDTDDDEDIEDEDECGPDGKVKI
jgi:hypothetical protein